MSNPWLILMRSSRAARALWEETCQTPDWANSTICVPLGQARQVPLGRAGGVRAGVWGPKPRKEGVNKFEVARWTNVSNRQKGPKFR